MSNLTRRYISGMVSAAAVVACAACGGSETTGPVPEPLPTPLSIVSGAGVTDTVQVTLTAPLVIAVTTIDGKPRPGVEVRFDAVGSPDMSRATERMISIAPPAGGAFAASDVETTDAQGRASVRIQFGTVSGAARVAITTADGMTDTARFTVGAGAAVAMTVAIHDTTINFNDTFALAARLRDRLGNARAEMPVTSSATLIGTGVTVSDGVVRAAASLGRSRIVVQGLGKTDSVFVNVVPAGTIAVTEDNAGALRIMQTNGRLIRRMLTISIVLHDGVRWPSWSPNGSHIAVNAGGFNNAYSIQLFDTLANAKLLSGASSRARYYGPQYTRDGQWLFFTEVDNATIPATNRVYRMHPDGTGKEVVYFESGANGFWTSASPSATGDFVILGGLSTQGSSAIPQVARLDVAQQPRLIPFPTSGSDAMYSPTANRVAMVDASGSILLAQSGGGGVQTLTTAAVSATSFGALSSLAWSPDGAYLLARSTSAGRYVVVRVSDGVMVPTAISSSLGQPSWR